MDRRRLQQHLLGRLLVAQRRLPQHLLGQLLVAQRRFGQHVQRHQHFRARGIEPDPVNPGQREPGGSHQVRALNRVAGARVELSVPRRASSSRAIALVVDRSSRLRGWLARSARPWLNAAKGAGPPRSGKSKRPGAEDGFSIERSIFGRCGVMRLTSPSRGCTFELEGMPHGGAWGDAGFSEEMWS